MNKRVLGNTGIEVSEIAFGGVEIGMPYGIGINGEEDMLVEKDAIDLLHLALDKGINFFDTARMYGKSEERMGKAFKDCRNRVVIASKCRHFRTDDGLLPDEAGIRKLIRDSLQESLKALQTDYIDIYMLHQADTEILKRGDIAEEMDKLKQNGVVRAIGVSTYSIAETKMAIESGVWNVVQLPFNLLDQRQFELFDLAFRYGVGIVIRSVLMKGLLSNRGKGLHENLASVENHIQQFYSLLNDQIKTLPDLAIKFALSFSQVSSVLIGIDKVAYLEQSLVAANGSYLQQDFLERARLLAYPNPEFLDLPYWDKMGWLR